MSEENTNCLEDRACPSCGQSDKLKVDVRTLMELTDEGTGYHGDTEYGDDAYCECPQCGWHGSWGDTFVAGHQTLVKVNAELVFRIPAAEVSLLKRGARLHRREDNKLTLWGRTAMGGETPVSQSLVNVGGVKLIEDDAPK